MIDITDLSTVIVQGITGTNGQLHAARMLDYGTPIVAGVTPGKGGQEVLGLPVYDSVADTVSRHGQIEASVIFVPARFAKSAIIEALDAQIPLIVVITEGIPVHDMLQISQHKNRGDSLIVGPNCPGLLVPGKHLLGIIPTDIATPGSAAVVSRSGTLTYEVMDGLSRRGIGQRYVIGIGGDRISGVDFVDCLQLFEADNSVDRIIMIGEIGGIAEIKAADYIQQSITKPVYAYIAGHTAPPGVQLGHAGAILGTNQLESAKAKTARLAKSGVTTADNLEALLDKVV